MRTPTSVNPILRVGALVAASGCILVTGCGTQRDVTEVAGAEDVVQTLPAPLPMDDAREADAAEAAVAWAFVGAWYEAEVWTAAGNYALAVVAYVDALRAATPAPVPALRPAAVRAPAGTGTPPNAFLACVRQRESGGSYTAVNSSSGAGGAYQFMPSTWRAMGGSGLPQNASPAEQDRMAAKLYAQSGTAPWAGGTRPC